jgi:hypothetical protein
MFQNIFLAWPGTNFLLTFLRMKNQKPKAATLYIVSSAKPPKVPKALENSPKEPALSIRLAATTECEMSMDIIINSNTKRKPTPLSSTEKRLEKKLTE